MLKPSPCKNTFVLVGADKGGVGKTTFTRALLDFLQAPAALRVFDTEPAPGVLKRFYPEAATVNMADPADQAAVIDGLGGARATIVDVRAGELSPTLHLLQRIGLKHDQETRVVVFHVLGNNTASLAEIAVTHALLAKGGGDHVLVKNRAAAGRFFEWDGGALERLKLVEPSDLIEIGYLEAVAAERVDQRGQSFAAFAADPENSRTMRGYVKAWAADNARALDALGVRNLFA